MTAWSRSEYQRLRASGLGIVDAAGGAGVTYETGCRYERWRQAEDRGETFLAREHAGDVPVRLHVGSPETGFRGPDASRRAGISYRQLDYWCRTGLVAPSIRPAEGAGTQRLYSLHDIRVLATIKRLLDAGVSLRRVREAVDRLRETYDEIPLEWTVEIAPGVQISVTEHDVTTMAGCDR